MKYWINLQKGEDKVIGINKEVFYFSSPNETQLNEFKYDLQMGKIPRHLTGTPFSLIRCIDFEEGSSKIVLYYNRKDDQKLFISDEKIRSELKDALEKIGPTYQARTIFTKSKIELSFRPLMGMLITSLLTYYIYTIAIDLEMGYTYTANGGLSNLYIGLAETAGKYGVLAIGSVVLLLLSFVLYKKLKTPVIIEQFLYR